jgi:hypothetical protein
MRKKKNLYANHHYRLAKMSEKMLLRKQIDLLSVMNIANDGEIALQTIYYLAKWN